MAYSATIVYDERVISGRRYWIVTVTEADGAVASEFELVNCPFSIATLVKYQATLVTGTSTGTTINPTLGKVTGWTANTQDHIGTNSATSAYIDDETHVTFELPLGSIFVQSTVDAGTDNDIITLMVFAEGVV